MTLAGVAAALWAAWEARRNNDMTPEPPNSVVVTSPQAADGCALVAKGQTLELKGTAKLATGMTLWEVTQASGDNKLWPGPIAQMDADGRSWSMTVASIGADGDKDRRFNLLLIAADPNAAPELRAAASATDYAPLAKLPEGTDVLGEVCVKRSS
ncbi:hypothetical protein OG216_20350 [Streptomycetaceae bacterium NBC_01309]